MKTVKNLLLSVLFVLVSVSCAENSSSLVIVQNQAPESGCTASNTVSDKFISHGVLDLGSARYGITPQYFAWFVIQNNLKSTVDNKGVELNNVEMKEAHISLSLGAASSGLESQFTHFADYTFVTIPPGESRSVQVNLIPPNVAERLNVQEGQFVEGYAKVKLIGERGGTEIETNTVNFPVTVCYGCLVTNIGPCDSATFPETVDEGQTCNKSQDEPLQCCKDPNASDSDHPYRCPAVQSTGSDTGEGSL